MKVSFNHKRQELVIRLPLGEARKLLAQMSRFYLLAPALQPLAREIASSLIR